MIITIKHWHGIVSEKNKNKQPGRKIEATKMMGIQPTQEQDNHNTAANMKEDKDDQKISRRWWQKYEGCNKKKYNKEVNNDE